MKKAISLLTSMMVMSLVAANMAIPASAAGTVTLDIDDITLSVDELQQNEKVTVDGKDYYAVNLDVLYTDTTGEGIGSFNLGLDTANSTLGLNPANSSGTKFAFTSNKEDSSYVFNDLDSSLNSKRGTLLIFTAEAEQDSDLYPSKLADGKTHKACAFSVLVPADATDGKYTLEWSSTVDDFWSADGATELVPELKGGSVTIGDGQQTTTTTNETPVDTKGTISIGDEVLEITGDTVAADTVVKVPVSIKDNPGFATADLYHELTIAPAASGATASYVVDGSKMVLDAGDLTTDKDLEGAATGKFPGKVMVVQNDAENITGDGVIYYVEITVPAGAKVGDKFDITFDRDGGDFELYNNDDMNTAIIPELVDGYIEIVKDPEQTTTTTSASETTTPAPETTTTSAATSGTTAQPTVTNPTGTNPGGNNTNDNDNNNSNSNQGGDNNNTNQGGDNSNSNSNTNSNQGGDNSNSNENNNGNTISNNPTINITVNGGGSADTGSTGTQAPTPTGTQGTTASASNTSATTKASGTTAATTKASTTTTKAKSSDSPSTGSTGIGATIMAMIAAAASAFALKKKND